MNEVTEDGPWRAKGLSCINIRDLLLLSYVLVKYMGNLLFLEGTDYSRKVIHLNQRGFFFLVISGPFDPNVISVWHRLILH